MLLLPASNVFAVHVNGYYRSNGTYVNGYERTAPDGNPYNNYSYPGNYNPNTGSITGGNPDTYLNNYYNNSSSYSSPYVPTTPTCPFMSTYDSVSSSCQCMSGYVVDSTGSCTSGNIVCHQKYGYGSSYNYSDKTCSCDAGYKFDSTGQCVSQLTYCTNTFGYGSEYSYLKSSCVCRTGYVVNSNTNKCELDTSSYTYPSSYIPPTTTTCPLNSYASGGSCYCSVGYQLSSDKASCVVTPVKTNDQICQDSFGINSIWIGTKNDNGTLNCNCKIGYEWDSVNKSSCVVHVVPVLPPPSVSIDKGSTSPETPKKTVPLVAKKKISPKTITASVINSIPENNSGVENNNININTDKWYQKIFNWFK